MKNLLNLFRAREHAPDAVALSAYLDRRLTADETATVDGHVETCAACRAMLADLGAVRASLRAAPQADVPRSFRLRQADVEAPIRRPASAPWMRALPAFGGLAAAVFVVAVAVDVRSGGGSGSDSMLTASAERAALDSTSPPSGGIAADDGAGAAYDNTGTRAPSPVMPNDSSVASPTGAEAGETAGDAATSDPQRGVAPGVKAGPDASPQIEAARDATTAADEEGWPLVRYLAVVAAIAALAAAGTWLGFALERRSK